MQTDLQSEYLYPPLVTDCKHIRDTDCHIKYQANTKHVDGLMKQRSKAVRPNNGIADVLPGILQSPQET